MKLPPPSPYDAVSLYFPTWFQLMMQLPHQALALLDQYLLTLQAHGTVYDQTNFLMCYFKCRVVIATRQAGDNKRECILIFSSFLDVSVSEKLM
ncbi:hypothetical protein DPMN_147318 [Dreissena polymorpha]|uniref:Uncharacterized protein n=1 Tax=Dreissena polymorpha TaxID=45954 RepID=A0A9D4FC14_DREPO|nr:hypothetical protein DPMN_147318 [Dreissena polymorpha]